MGQDLRPTEYRLSAYLVLNSDRMLQLQELLDKVWGEEGASVHIASNPWPGSGYRMEIYGREGTLIVSSEASPNTNTLRLQGVREGSTLEDLEVPEKYVYVLDGMPQGEHYNVGQMYYQFGQSILSGNNCELHQAVELHRFIDNMRQASDQGREVAAGTA